MDLLTQGLLGGALGSILGALSTIWCVAAIIGIVIRRWRIAVLGSGGLMLGLCACMLIYGLIAFLQGHPYFTWYSWALIGFIGVVNFGVLLPLAYYAYRYREQRHMKAMDDAQNL